MRVPKLIATDLDGTFLSPDESVSAENAEAVLAAQACGITVMFVTGRPVRWLGMAKDLPGGHPTLIASNGAVLYDVAESRALDRITISAATALTAVDRVRRVVPDVRFAFESGTLFGHEPHYIPWAPTAPNDPQIRSGEVADIVHDDLVKLLVQSPALRSDELLARVESVTSDLLTSTHSATKSYGLVEVSAKGVDKGAMLARVCRRMGIGPEDVAAFGDMPNDLPMLAWAGQPYVVANAHPSMLKLGFPIVPAHTESGVGRTILQMLSGGRGLDLAARTH